MSRSTRVLRLFFATDIHGSEICWRKFLAAAGFYEAAALVLGGDMTGKALVPIVKRRDGRWRSVLLQQAHELETESEVAAMEASIASRGYYPFRTDEDAMKSLASDPDAVDALFRKIAAEKVYHWMELADRKLAGSGIPCFVCPGNDDSFEIDTIVASSSSISSAEGRIVDLGGGFSLASTGWSNPTPWKTHREEGEAELYARISAIVPSDGDYSRTVFGFHAPPYASGLDDAPELDGELNVLNAGQSTVPVGSSAVRRAIEEGRPVLSLHGHIHEAKGAARIGSTLCINPGSLYEQGILQGALVDLDPRRGVAAYLLTTG